jgi:hypothetical protein
VGGGNDARFQFEGYQIRPIMDEETGEWWYAVVAVIEALTDSQKPRDYWYRMKKRVAENEGIQLSTICRQFKLKASNNRFYDTDYANTELFHCRLRRTPIAPICTPGITPRAGRVVVLAACWPVW